MAEKGEVMQERTTLVTVTAILYLLTGVAYSIGTIPVSRYLIRFRQLPTFGGIHFYEGGFFDRHGINWVIAASLLYILLGIGFILVGFLLWNSKGAGAVLAVALLPIVLAVSIGSLAPFPLVVEPIKVIFVLLSWSSLS
jgi:hypothetical protein